MKSIVGGTRIFHFHNTHPLRLIVQDGRIPSHYYGIISSITAREHGWITGPLGSLDVNSRWKTPLCSPMGTGTSEPLIHIYIHAHIHTDG
jgi:hypothetical protein